jgi:hypothetical protein
MNWDVLKEGFELIGLGMLSSVVFGSATVYILNRFYPRLAPQPTKAFKSNNEQVVIIPATLAYPQPDIELDIERVGDELRIRPRQPAHPEQARRART